MKITLEFDTTAQFIEFLNSIQVREVKSDEFNDKLDVVVSKLESFEKPDFK